MQECRSRLKWDGLPEKYLPFSQDFYSTSTPQDFLEFSKAISARSHVTLPDIVIIRATFLTAHARAPKMATPTSIRWLPQPQIFENHVLHCDHHDDLPTRMRVAGSHGRHRQVSRSGEDLIGPHRHRGAQREEKILHRRRWVATQRRGSYSWIGPQEQLHKKLICQHTEIATDIPKPSLESSQKGASSPGGSFLCRYFLQICDLEHLQSDHGIGSPKCPPKSFHLGIPKHYTSSYSRPTEKCYLGKI